jgi:hypothetical protein
MEGQVSRLTAETSMDDKSLIQPHIGANYSPRILNSTDSSYLRLPNPGPVNKKKLNGISLHVEKHHLPPLSLLNLPDLSGDLESQLRCLRQVQYNLEYLFDELLQSVKEASSDGNVDQDLFDILNHSILLSTDMTLPGLMLPSYTETDGRKLSPVSSHSTEVSQQSQDEDHWGAVFDLNACGIDVPSNGLSPSYFADSDISVSWCPTLEAVPPMHGTGLYTREKVGSRNSRFSFFGHSRFFSKVSQNTFSLLYACMAFADMLLVFIWSSCSLSSYGQRNKWTWFIVLVSWQLNLNLCSL